MGIKNRLQRFAWAVGGLFCEIGDQEMLRRQQEGDHNLAEEMRLLRQHQEEGRRLLDLQEETLVKMRAHQVICDQERVAMLARLDAMNEDRLELLRIITGDKPIAPDIRLISGSP